MLITNLSLGVSFHLPVAFFKISFRSRRIVSLLRSEFVTPRRSRFKVSCSNSFREGMSSNLMGRHCISRPRRSSRSRRMSSSEGTEMRPRVSSPQSDHAFTKSGAPRAQGFFEDDAHAWLHRCAHARRLFALIPQRHFGGRLVQGLRHRHRIGLISHANHCGKAKANDESAVRAREQRG